jgi:hypothetical protein
MYLFLFTCIPLALIIHILGRKQSTDIAILWGFFAGLVVCLLDYFFIFRDPMVGTAFKSRAFSAILFTGIIPQAGLFLPFALFSRNTLHYKAGCFFPLVASFYAVFIPYRVLNAPLLPGYFEILFLPLIYTLVTFVEGLCFGTLTRQRKTSPG